MNSGSIGQRHSSFGRSPARAFLAVAVGAFAFGAVATGFYAIGRLAIGKLAVGRAKLGTVEIDDLTVRRLHLLEPPTRK